jgi:hypothetical protein
MLQTVAQVKKSKDELYEILYAIKGSIQLAGLEETSKGICKDKVIGTR